MTRALATRSVLLSAVLGLLLAATGWSAGLMPDAGAQGGDFEISVSSVVLLSGETGDVTLTIAPGATSAAAVTGFVTYDPAQLTATSCTPWTSSSLNLPSPAATGVNETGSNRTPSSS